MNAALDSPTGNIVASDGRVLHLLLWQSSENDIPALTDAHGNIVAPWEVELLRWPVSTEAALRRGGYLIERFPDPREPWCNCAD